MPERTMKPSVSVITLSFNQGQFLDRAMQSVLTQNYPVEHILVDPGSTDGSRRKIERRAKDVAVMIFEPDNGPAEGLNKALRRASGDLVVCVNADDGLLPGAAAAAAAAFTAYPDAGAIYASGYMVDSAGMSHRRFRSTDFDLRRFAFGGVNVMHQATFVRRSAALEVGGFNEMNQTSWDAELLVDLALAGYEIRRVDGMWGMFTLHSASISGSGRNQAQYRKDKLRLFNRLVGRYPTPRDQLVSHLVRLEKWLRNPAYTAWRIQDLFRSPISVMQSE